MLIKPCFHSKVRNQNILLEDKAKERTKELRDSRLEIIQRLSLVAEYKDPETGNHIIRMSKMCQALARAAGFSEEGAELILQASPMHDIGKIGIPDSIITKPGKLDQVEWKIMKTHTDISGAILDNHPSSLLKLGKSIALIHHERWDGTGYPNGLKGEQIPVVGRICAICDVFDALISERSYKNAWTVPDSIDEIIRGKGKHFDPSLVDTFLSIVSSILEIKKNLKQYGGPPAGGSPSLQ